MLAFLRFEYIHLSSSRSKSSGILSHYSKQDNLGHIAKVKSDFSPVGTTIFSNFMPDNIGLVCKSPSLHNLKAFAQKCIRNP